jgi:predicted PurR-regulated permease PerM
MALHVALLYLGLQTVESYVLQPVIQDHSVNLPPAVVIGAQLLLGVLLGTLGVMFATPLVAAAFVVVKMLYVRDTLGDPIEVRGERRE